MSLWTLYLLILANVLLVLLALFQHRQNKKLIRVYSPLAFRLEQAEKKIRALRNCLEFQVEVNADLYNQIEAIASNDEATDEINYEITVPDESSPISHQDAAEVVENPITEDTSLPA